MLKVPYLNKNEHRVTTQFTDGFDASISAHIACIMACERYFKVLTLSESELNTYTYRSEPSVRTI